MYNTIITVLLLIAASLLQPLSVYAQTEVHSFEQIDSLQQTEKRNVVIFIHTDWCRYCQAMKNTTFQDDSISLLLNEQFWYTELNGEERKNINFNQHIFKYKPTGNNTGTHELAEQLGTIDGKLSYPSLCILNRDYEIIFQYDQFLSASDLLQVLTQLKGDKK